MHAAFWACAVLVLYTYFGYPALVFLLSRVVRRPIRRQAHTPRVTFLVAAYNEQAVIERKLRNTLALDYPADQLEVVVASDGSTDATNDIVRSFESRGVRLIAGNPRRGKNGLVNAVLPETRGDIVVISDANIDLAPDALRELIAPFGDPEVGGAWGNKIYRNPGASTGGEGEALYLRYEKFMKSCETRIGSIVAGECSCLAFRRSVFRDVPLDVPDDFALSTNVVHAGQRMLFVSESKTYEDTSPSNRDEFRRKVRIIERGIRGFFRVLPLANPFRTGFYAVSLITRQLLRRLVAVLFLIMLLLLPFLSAGDPAYRPILIVALVILALAGLGAIVRGRLRQMPWFFIPYYFVLVNVAALYGLGRCLFGQRSITWQPTGRTAPTGNAGR